MKLALSPRRADTPLTLSCAGETLMFNGETLDLSAIPDGASLPAEAVASDWIVGPISRNDGELSLTIALPCGANAPDETRFPQPITVIQDGPIMLPPYQLEEITA
ncbi:hypothetical protein [Thioclava indica]|uniref:Uncharacterized protein n=1 Tax=Thioclava indica TaxID=1353528 RepID=A0A074JUE2_9RHOB|nr:hypothetical protein [Thioclava indica]KEO61296.1 hypothetical protein DT23_09395 [Thioclava indica]